MVSAVSSSVSALRAASVSLSARADNVAHVRTTVRVDEVSIDRPLRQNPADGVFRPTRPTFIAREGGGVDVKIEEVDHSHIVVFDPQDAMADGDGQVAVPTANLEADLVGSIQDRTMFVANLAVMRTQDETIGALLDDEV
jgi:flagellar basal body rod protein FlgC